MSESEIACRLDAIEVGFRPKQKHNFKSLLAEAKAVNELPDGYEFVLDIDHLERLGSLIAKERECCAFFRFAIIVEPTADSLQFQLTGGEGVKAFIAQEQKKPPQFRGG